MAKHVREPKHLTLYRWVKYVYGQIIEWLMPSDFCLVDAEKNKVIFHGRYHEVEHYMDQRYGQPLMIFREHELPKDCDITELQPSHTPAGRY